MSDLLLDLGDVIVRVLEVDLFDGDNLLRRDVHALVDDAEGASAELLEDGVLAGGIGVGQERHLRG